MPTESSKWRKLLEPAIKGLIILMTAAVGYLQFLQKQEGEKRDARIAVLENQASEQVKRSDKFDRKIDAFEITLSDIRSDVSFIRGKLEVMGTSRAP